MKYEDYKLEIPEVIVDEIDFDIEEWRSEQPVDYLKMMHLIDSLPDRSLAFSVIYKVMRLYIPDTLYKYYSLTDNINLNEQKFETLQNKKIYTCEAKYLNDPFDNKAYFYNNNELKKYEVLKEHDGRLIEDFSMFSKVTALTSNKINSMPMWAHYSNNHQGFCVSYDMRSKENLELSSCTFPVQYTDERIDITSIMMEQMENLLKQTAIQTSGGAKEIIIEDLSIIFMTSLFANIKHASWSYENEFRCTLGIGKERSSYVNAVPKEIFIGMQCVPTHRDKLISLGRELEIPVYQMTYEELNMEFNLVPKLL